MQILPARDIAGAHGKTYSFIGFDEIHGYRNHDLFEALAPDPTRSRLAWSRGLTSCARSLALTSGFRYEEGLPLLQENEL